MSCFSVHIWNLYFLTGKFRPFRFNYWYNCINNYCVTVFCCCSCAFFFFIVLIFMSSLVLTFLYDLIFFSSQNDNYSSFLKDFLSDYPWVCSVAQLCLTLWDSMDCSLPGSSIHEIFQEIILEWVAISSFRGSSQPKDRTCTSCISWITSVSLISYSPIQNKT